MNCNLIDQLCLENKIVPFYDKVLTSKLTNQRINIAHSQGISDKIANCYTVSDVPDFLDVLLLENNENIKVKKIPQYKGYLIDLTRFNDANELFTKTLSKNPRKNFRAKKRKLEAIHDIGYHFYYGDISKEYYNYLFEICYTLMENRFHQKRFIIGI